MSGVVLTFPILAGKVEAWRRFCQEMAGSRCQLYEESRKRLAITRERMTLVETPYGAMAVTTLEGSNMDGALGQIIASNLPFDVWYRKRLHEMHGINLTRYEQFAQPVVLPHNQDVHFTWTLKSDLQN